MGKFSEWVSESFIWGVGVTRPKPGTERFAARFITGLLFGSVLFLAAVFLLVATHI
ncbi:hypothetical protein [Terriglobus tenax]|uniref:hypothetical protein n=1 Tax=Terriglobus tenax TaxID=1111115 RepID=UPI0021E0FA5E|nr:hypothetical protein [Terriglobus tenax]